MIRGVDHAGEADELLLTFLLIRLQPNHNWKVKDGRRRPKFQCNFQITGDGRMQAGIAALKRGIKKRFDSSDWKCVGCCKFIFGADAGEWSGMRDGDV